MREDEPGKFYFREEEGNQCLRRRWIPRATTLFQCLPYRLQLERDRASCLVLSFDGKGDISVSSSSRGGSRCGWH